MTSKQPIGTTDPGALPPDFMLPDPPMIPDFQRRAHRTRIATALDIYYSERRDDVLSAGGGYLRHDPMNEGERYAPDCVVAFGVDPKAIIARNGYLISEVGKPPDFALDVACQDVGMIDRSIERETYERYQAREYWRLDASKRWQAAPLEGDRLVNGKYVPIEIIQDEDGGLWGYSEALSLSLCWDGEFLRFYDGTAGRFLPNAVELAREVAAMKAEIRHLREMKRRRG